MQASPAANPAPVSHAAAKGHTAAKGKHSSASGVAVKAPLSPFDMLMALGAEASNDGTGDLAGATTQTADTSGFAAILAASAADHRPAGDKNADPSLTPVVFNPLAALLGGAAPAKAPEAQTNAASAPPAGPATPQSPIDPNVAANPATATLHWNISELFQPVRTALCQVISDASYRGDPAFLGHSHPGDNPFGDAAVKGSASQDPLSVISSLQSGSASSDQHHGSDDSGGLGSLLGFAKPEAASAAPAPLQADPAANGSAVVQQIHRLTEMMSQRVDGSVRMNDKTVQASLRLDPPDLGNLRVTLQVQADNSVQAHFVADRPETAQLIQQHVNQLQEGLSRQGLTVDRIQIGVASESSGSQPQGGNTPGWTKSGGEGQRQQAQQSMNESRQRQQDARREQGFYRSFDGALS